MPDTNRNERATGSMYRTWGLGRRAEPLEIYDPGKFKFIARVLDHLGLRLIDVRGDGEPAQIALGEARNPDDPDAVSRRTCGSPSRPPARTSDAAMPWNPPRDSFAG